MLPTRHYTLEQAPDRRGPWRFLRSANTDLENAVKLAIELQPTCTWVRLVPEGLVERATYMRPDDI